MNDLQMLWNEDAWPAWPCLPMKKPGKGFPEVGYVLAGTQSLFKGNIFNPKEDDPVIIEGFENILAAGWIVD